MTVPNLMLHELFSPRKRRCFCPILSHHAERMVFSAQAEVFPCCKPALARPLGFLRASGGVSNTQASASVQGRFSPRKRRCF